MELSETIREKLKKLYDLAERGEAGEAAKAKILLDKRLNELGITVEELFDVKKEDYCFKVGRGVNGELKLLFAVIHRVLNKYTFDYARNKAKDRIWVNMTYAEYVEAKSMYEFYLKSYRKAFKKQEEEFAEAFILRNNITASVRVPGNSESVDLTPEEMAKAIHIGNLMSSIPNTPYLKQLEK